MENYRTTFDKMKREVSKELVDNEYPIVQPWEEHHITRSVNHKPYFDATIISKLILHQRGLINKKDISILVDQYESENQRKRS